MTEIKVWAATEVTALAHVSSLELSHRSKIDAPQFETVECLGRLKGELFQSIPYIVRHLSLEALESPEVSTVGGFAVSVLCGRSPVGSAP